jgi:hypothetical protein
MKAGRAAGCYSILVGSTESATAPDLVAPDLGSAARAIIERSGGRCSLRAPFIMVLRRRGAMGECEARTQGAPVFLQYRGD